MTININITGLEKLEPYVEKLAAILLDATKGVAVQTNQTQMAEPVAPQMPAQPTMPYQQPVPNASPATPQQPVPAQNSTPNNQIMGGLPTSATPQSYTQDQIAVAMTGLVDRGMQPQVMAILSAVGCQTLLQVPKERYPELVTKLREAGAAI